jgi:hypothetical protein
MPSFRHKFQWRTLDKSRLDVVPRGNQDRDETRNFRQPFTLEYALAKRCPDEGDAPVIGVGRGPTQPRVATGTERSATLASTT